VCLLCLFLFSKSHSVTLLLDQFSAFAACNVKAASYDAVVAPRAEMNDGQIDLVFTRNVDRTDLAAFLLDMGRCTSEYSNALPTDGCRVCFRSC
jgi:hypothetical protein